MKKKEEEALQKNKSVLRSNGFERSSVALQNRTPSATSSTFHGATRTKLPDCEATSIRSTSPRQAARPAHSAASLESRLLSVQHSRRRNGVVNSIVRFGHEIVTFEEDVSLSRDAFMTLLESCTFSQIWLSS